MACLAGPRSGHGTPRGISGTPWATARDPHGVSAWITIDELAGDETHGINLTGEVWACWRGAGPPARPYRGARRRARGTNCSPPASCPCRPPRARTWCGGGSARRRLRRPGGPPYVRKILNVPVLAVTPVTS